MESVKLFLIAVVGLGIVVLVGLLVVHSITSRDCCICGSGNGCCPCPNNEWVDKVEEWSGREACCSFTWLEMCEGYQKANNVTFDCFK